MGARHTGREAALQILFLMETSDLSAAEAAPVFFRHFDADPDGMAYAQEIAAGVDQSRTQIDETIKKASEHWRLERMARVDRNVIRLATWELLQKKEVPRAVILDEAVELAKTFGTEESSAFVNGVLNRVADLVGRVDGDR
jgi:N utilization substance protein B